MDVSGDIVNGIRIALGTTAAVVVLGAVEVLLCLAVLAQWQVLQAPRPANLAEALILVIVAVAAALGAWLLVSTLAAVVAHLPGRLGAAADRGARAWAPAVSRRVAAVLVGAAMGGALAPGTAVANGPTLASPAGSGLTPGFTKTSPQGPAGDERTGVGAVGPGFAPTLPATRGPAATPAPGWTPSRPVQRAHPHSGLVTGGGTSHREADVVVHRGDTLWDIARRHLGPGATDAEVALAWPAWHDANRAMLGDDPDLILPGQILRPPTARELAAQSSGTIR